MAFSSEPPPRAYMPFVTAARGLQGPRGSTGERREALILLGGGIRRLASLAQLLGRFLLAGLGTLRHVPGTMIAGLWRPTARATGTSLAGALGSSTALFPRSRFRLLRQRCHQHE